MTEKKLTLWQQYDKGLLPVKVTSPAEITEYATQLSVRDRKQIAQSFEAGNYEIALNYVWAKAMAALKRELATLGIKFLGEMLNKPDLREDDDVFDVVTDKEAVRLAEELGIASPTEAMRLRHAQDLVTHFSQLDSLQSSQEASQMEPDEAMQALKTCVRNILGKPKIEVATKFIEFRDALISETLKPTDHRIKTLLSSPYFFHKLTVSILLSNIKKNVGAKLEHVLANFNLLIPQLWDGIRDTEKWQIGHTYAEVHAAGLATTVAGLRVALLKVKGFDYVPENLRSDTFIKAAENVIKAHEGMNNFYNEKAPMQVLANLGSTIPTPALAICTSAILAVRLGNYYGASWFALPIAEELLEGFTQDRWQYYINQCLPGDVRILEKLSSDKPIENWFKVVKKHALHNLNIKHKDVAMLISNSAAENKSKVITYSDKIMQSYYGLQKKRTKS